MTKTGTVEALHYGASVNIGYGSEPRANSLTQWKERKQVKSHILPVSR